VTLLTKVEVGNNCTLERELEVMPVTAPVQLDIRLLLSMAEMLMLP